MNADSTTCSLREENSKNQNDSYLYSLNNEEFNRELLKKNPNAAVVNPDLICTKE